MTFINQRGFPSSSSGKESVCNAGDLVWFLGWEGPLEKRQATPIPITPVFLPGKSHGRRGLVGYSPWGLKELDTTE